MNNEVETHQLVQAQFGKSAAAYTTSTSHANADALQQLVVLAQPQPTDRALDIATGAGHAALTLAPYVAEVVAFDLTPQMLEETARNATKKGLTNLTTRQGLAEELPYPDNSFEIVCCRIAPHHFASIQKAVDEMARVVKPGGRVVIIDTTVPEDETLDREINYIEKQRDPSHVRNYNPSEWRSMFEQTGLKITHLEYNLPLEHSRLNFADWTARMHTPAATVAELAGLLCNASPALQAALNLEISGDKNEDIFFTLPRVSVVATKVG
jgi:ubiquinone/menaquinone biosynthesis C-methylase UbiE